MWSSWTSIVLVFGSEVIKIAVIPLALAMGI